MGPEKTDDSVKPWMSPSVVKTYKQLYFKIIKAENIPKMDTLGTTDGYLKIQLDSTSKVKTKVDTMKNKKIEWDQEVLVPVELPSTKDDLDF